MSMGPPIGGGFLSAGRVAFGAVYACDIVRLLQAHRLPLGNEKALQSAVANVLVAEGIVFEREYRLSGRDIVDFLIDCGGVHVGLELKVKGAARDIIRQCERYCAHDLIGSLVLGTRRAMALPPLMHAKPCYVASLGMGWL